ncbi:MAG: SDR family NAD(P)-dependent oxidoreductase [Bacteroidetes bacterium]|nr:SDR family NAD(P)-dependent oxidoreductase [Bacteroidota bacterium]
MNVQNKNIVVTGGGSGMGRELTLLLLKKGATVAIVDINEANLAATKELAGNKKDKISTHVANIADKTAVENLYKEIIAVHKNVDILFNNAGIIQPFVKVNDLDFSAIERVMNVNFYGLLYMTKTFLPHLLQRPEAHIVNTSSMGGFLPVPGQALYGASKAAVKLLTEALYSELLNTNVKVTVVFPGAINTNITSNSGVNIPAGNTAEAKQQEQKMKPLAADKAAQMIVNGVEKNKLHVYVGSDSSMMNKLYRFVPKYAINFIAKQMQSLLK